MFVFLLSSLDRAHLLSGSVSENHGSLPSICSLIHITPSLRTWSALQLPRTSCIGYNEHSCVLDAELSPTIGLTRCRIRHVEYQPQQHHLLCKLP